MLAKKKDNYSVQDSNNLSTKDISIYTDRQSSKQSLITLRDSFDLANIDLKQFTPKELEEEIIRTEKMYKNYHTLMYMISANSGAFNFNNFINYYYISETLGRSTADWSILMALQGLAWSSKPIYGWISDSFYPFKYRFKPYIFLFSLLHILVCLFVIITEPKFEIFCFTHFLINMSVAFIDTMAEGITAINTKLGIKIGKLKDTKRRMTGTVEDTDDLENNMKSFAVFSASRGIFRAFMGLFSGYMADKASLQINYTILGTYPVMMIFYTLFIFREHKVILKFQKKNKF